MYKDETVEQHGLTFPNGLFKASNALSKISDVNRMSLENTNCQYVTLNYQKKTQHAQTRFKYERNSSI